MAFDARGSLYVSEWRAGRVTRIDGDRKRANFADGLSGPSGLAIGADGTIYVASYSGNLVYRFTRDGARSIRAAALGMVHPNKTTRESNARSLHRRARRRGV